MHIKSVAVTVLLLLALLEISGCSRTHKEPAVSVAAAADLKFALDEIIVAFQHRHPDIQVGVTYGASGTFYAQLSNHAPFDLFFSADMAYPHRLIEQGFAAPDSAFIYAVGHLVVWVPRKSHLDFEKEGLQALLNPAVRTIAIANPRHAPYGRAAEAALKSAGVYEKVQQRLVYGENVAQTAQFVQTGSADVGLIALSLALDPALAAWGRTWEIPVDTYPRMEQGGLILSWAKDRRTAEALRDFMLGEQGKPILRRYGFSLPEK
ncbi:MAG TPA: molybdate ABC transporter substrate-binding protein [Gemmataceae bacterium]|nr:molybdate ABC transporter substrate-binding protein [Gemmataceae bacterium]